MRFWTGRCLTTLALIVALLLAGCQRPSVVGGRPPDKFYRVIVSLSPDTTELIGNFGFLSVLKGRTQACNYPRNVATVPVVCDVKPHYEKISAMHPDLIVYDEDLFSDAERLKLKELGFELMPMRAHSLAEFEDFLYRLGAITMSATKYSEYVDRIEAARQLALANQPEPKPKVAILMGGPGGEYWVDGKQSFRAQIVSIAGGVPVGPEGTRFQPANIEALVAMNPDVILVAGKDQARPVLNDPRLKSIAAVRRMSVVGIDPDVLLRTGARVDLLIKTVNQYLAGVAMVEKP